MQQLIGVAVVKVTDDPIDPVFVTTGLIPHTIELQIGDAPGARRARLSPAQARRVATALLSGADHVEANGPP